MKKQIFVKRPPINMLYKRNKATLLKSNPGSVRALIALHHGRKTMSRSSEHLLWQRDSVNKRGM